MEDQKKCSSKKHSDINAISFCQECNKYMCHKCENMHNELFEEHHKYSLKENINEIFTGICKEPNHKNDLVFFCDDHNQLCCSSCISKIKDNGYGQHSKCKIFTLDEIKYSKIDILTKKINKLIELSYNIDDNIINELKKIIEKVNVNKEELKLKISKIFTQIRNVINQREDELLSEVDSIYNKFYLDEEFINKNKNFKNIIKKTLEKAKLIKKEWDNNNNIKLNSIINDCLNIENNYYNIKEIYYNIEECKSNNYEIIFNPNNENEINNYLENIKKFGDFGDFNKLIFKSDIIGDDIKAQKKIKDWINPKAEIKFSLLFKMSRDGSNCADFHRLCDNKDKTLTIIETDNGFKFGGFTSINWKNYNPPRHIIDDSAFLFSINKMKKYGKKDDESDECLIYTGYNYGPSFGDCDIVINKDMRTGSSSNIFSSFTFLDDIDLTNGFSRYNIKEIEIYKIDFKN